MNPRTEQFPIHYEDAVTVVYTNHCGEVFVLNKRKGGAGLRISSYGNEFRVYAHLGCFTPTSEVRVSTQG